MRLLKNKKVRCIVIILLLTVMSFIILYVGHFLFSNEKENMTLPDESTLQTAPIESTAMPAVNPVKHIARTETINGLKQEINILEIDVEATGVQIQPVLSHDLIYGFELLSEMSERKKAYAAVNGGFFHAYGLPSGMVVVNGELVSASTGRYPVFVIEEEKAELKEIKSKLIVEYWRSAELGKSDINVISSVPIDIYNFPLTNVKNVETAVYTPVYGKYNRVDRKNITATVENGIVTKIGFYSGETGIPKNGMVISFFDIEKYDGIELPIKVGDDVRLIHQPFMGGNANAYECGSWLIRGGEIVVPLKDAWVGVLTNRDPRTAIGIKEDGAVVLITVDGRQPGYSYGFTGKELAEYLVSYGVRDAAMLDGGASTEMLVEGKLVNKPNHKGEERPVGGGILVLMEK